MSKPQAVYPHFRSLTNPAGTACGTTPNDVYPVTKNPDEVQCLSCKPFVEIFLTERRLLSRIESPKGYSISQLNNEDLKGLEALVNVLRANGVSAFEHNGFRIEL